MSSVYLSFYSQSGQRVNSHLLKASWDRVLAPALPTPRKDQERKDPTPPIVIPLHRGTEERGRYASHWMAFLFVSVSGSGASLCVQ